MSESVKFTMISAVVLVMAAIIGAVCFTNNEMKMNQSGPKVNDLAAIVKNLARQPDMLPLKAPSPKWIAKYGDSEMSRLTFVTFAQNQRQNALSEKMLDVCERLRKLEGVDPNSTEEVKDPNE